MSRVLFFFAGLMALACTSAIAQQPGAATGNAQPLGGPEIRGVCLLSQEAVLAGSKVGQAATARLRELAQQAQADMDGERRPISADAQTLQSQQSTLKPADFATKQQALAQRVQAVEQKARLRSQQLEATREKAVARISQEAQPAIASIYKAHSCGLLVNRNAILGGNMSGDITADVVKALDAKMTTITFDLESLQTPPTPTQQPATPAR